MIFSAVIHLSLGQQRHHGSGAGELRLNDGTFGSNSGAVLRSSRKDARSQQEVQALTQMVVEVTDRGRGFVDVKKIGKPDILRGTRGQVVKEWQAWSYMFVT